MANIVFDFLHNYETGERRESEPANAYQYDEGHVLEAVLPAVATSVELHYWIRGMEEAEAYTPTSITPNADGSCTVIGNIPNKYFETNGELRVYIVVTDGDASITTYEGKLHICQRSMPDDYVDDDPENEATRILAEAQAAAATATQQAQAASNSAGQAQQSAETLSQSVEQITTNKNDISSLKEDKADIDGYYQDMAVGDAEQLISTVYTEDSVPYNFRKTAGDGDRAYVDAVVGGTVVLNQLTKDGDFPSGHNWGTYNATLDVVDGVAAITPTFASSRIYQIIDVVINHKYIMMANFKGTSGSALLSWYGGIARSVAFTENWASVAFILNNTFQTAKNWQLYYGAQENRELASYQVKDAMCIDLTQMFGSTIADYVYGLETATAGAGVAWLKEHFHKIFNSGYVPHNAGTLVGVSGLSAKRTVGFNQLDESIDGDVHGSYRYIYIPIGETNQLYMGLKEKDSTVSLTGVYFGFFKDPANAALGNNWVIANGFLSNNRSNVSTSGASGELCGYVIVYPSTKETFDKIKSKYNICINLSDPARNGEYEPYEEHTYPLDSSQTLRGIPKLDSANRLYFDGDRYLPDGQIGRNIYEFVITDASVIGVGTASTGVKYATISIPVSAIIERTGSALMAEYVHVVGVPTVDKVFRVSLSNAYVYDNTFTDLATAKTALVGKKIVYTLAEPTTETAEPYQQRQIIDADGTEEFVSTSVVPVGHNTRYVPNLRAKLEKSPDSPSSDGVYIVQRSNGVNTYVPLASSTTIQDILNRLTALEGA